MDKDKLAKLQAQVRIGKSKILSLFHVACTGVRLGEPGCIGQQDSCGLTDVFSQVEKARLDESRLRNPPHRPKAMIGNSKLH